ncbi:MAG: hypothetical protein ABSF32_09210 [Ignavibacteria bacterium]|jgi:hypothetical protein
MKPSNSPQNITKENKTSTDQYISHIKNEDFTETFPAVEKWLRERSYRLNNIKEERKIVRMKNYFLVHKMRFVYTFIILALLAGACSLPVTQNETIGHVITWTMPPGTSSDQFINFPWVDRSKLSVSENTDNGKTENIYTLMLPGSTDIEVQKYQKDLEKIHDITSIKIFPLNENVKRPVYAAALHSFFRINVNATKMSDEELSRQIENQLKENGIQNISLDVKTDIDGRRKIKLNLDQNDKTLKNFELRIDDEKNQEVLKEVKKTVDQDKFRGKSDEEIRNMVKEDLNNPDIKDKDIQIIRENGEVKVKVNVEKEK